MRFSESWLKEWVAYRDDANSLANILTMAGLEVDEIETVAPPFDNIVIGWVQDVQAHPDADKLSVCTVKVDENQTALTIVCGASNVMSGQKVAVAKIGTVMPLNGMKIKKAKLRGIPSEGMICSAAELGLSTSSEGIMVLPEDAPIGLCIRAYLGLDDVILDIDFTPNRGDCLSIRGLAQEISALTQVEFKDVVCDIEAPVTLETKVTPYVEVPKDCPNYVCRLIDNLARKEIQTPSWMVDRLTRVGIASISPIVDITNYVMMELGQPMHAFDADKIEGDIVVRDAVKGEKLKLLDGQEVTLREGTLVIADQKKLLAIAGIMGGLDSSVTESTTRILLESALFTASKVAGIARSYGLTTDSAYRFERGVSPDLQILAIERATQLILSLYDGAVGVLSQKQEVEAVPKPKKISLNLHHLNRLLGLSLSHDQVRTYLDALGFPYQTVAEGFSVEAPACRYDLTIEADLIEEIARIYGYDNIEPKPIVAAFHAGIELKAYDSDDIRQRLVSVGYNEAINYSFVCPKQHQTLYPNVASPVLLNPISEELSQMRAGLLVGLLTAAVGNNNRQILDQQLFEIGMCFYSDGDQLVQKEMVAGVLIGVDNRVDWSKPTRGRDFYDIKGHIEYMFGEQANQIKYQSCEHDAYHPGQSASLYKDEICIGHIGALHPRIAKQLELPSQVYQFEIDLGYILSKHMPIYQSLSKYPSIKRDISFLVNKETEYADIERVIRCHNESGILKQIDLFDVYHGKNIPENRKSLAVGLILQHPSRTLVDEEVNVFMSAILQSLSEEFNITLRE